MGFSQGITMIMMIIIIIMNIFNFSDLAFKTLSTYKNRADSHARHALQGPLHSNRSKNKKQKKTTSHDCAYTNTDMILR